MHALQWRIQDFPDDGWDGANRSEGVRKHIILAICFSKNAWNWNKIGPSEGARAFLAPPPGSANALFKVFSCRSFADLGMSPPCGPKCSQFHAVFLWTIWRNRMWALPRGLAPPPLRNPGSGPPHVLLHKYFPTIFYSIILCFRLGVCPSLVGKEFRWF